MGLPVTTMVLSSQLNSGGLPQVFFPKVLCDKRWCISNTLMFSCASNAFAEADLVAFSRPDASTFVLKNQATKESKTTQSRRRNRKNDDEGKIQT